MLKDYYFMVHPPKEDDLDLPDDTMPKVIDFDKLSSQKKALFKEDWDRTTKKGDPV